MTGHKFFAGDINEVLMQVQKDCAPDLAGALFEAARDRYLLAANLVGINLVMTELVRNTRKRDYRPLAESYTIIAAHFRYRYPDANQLPLFTSAPIYKDEPLTDKWIRFYYGETWRLVQNNDDLCRNVVVAGTYPWLDHGRLAASQVVKRLSDIYALVDWAYPAVSAIYYAE